MADTPKTIPKTVKVEVDGEITEVPNPVWLALEADRLALEEEAANALIAEEEAAARAAEVAASLEREEFDREYQRLERLETIEQNRAVLEQQRRAREAEIQAARDEETQALREQEAEDARLTVLRDTFLVVLGVIQAEGGEGEVGYHKEDQDTIDRQVAFLMAYSDAGTVKAAAEQARVPRSTHQIWLKDPRYQEAFSLAQELAGDLLEQEAIRRAAHGVPEPVFYRGEVVGAVKKYSDALLTFLLKGNRPEKFRERFDISNPHDEMRKLATLLGVTPGEVAVMMSTGSLPKVLSKLGVGETAPPKTAGSGSGTKSSVH